MLGNDISTKALRTFLAVAQEKSFSGAGIKLNVSQATVSIRIRGLERQLGVSLFERGRGIIGARLTADGRVLFADAEAMLALHDRIARLVRPPERR